MELQELYELMERFSASGLTRLEWRRKDEEIALHKEPVRVAGTACEAGAALSIPADPPKEEAADYVKSPLVGVFYAASAPGEEPFAVPGKRVKRGETLCIIEAMKMLSEVPAPADCVVEEVLVTDGAPVGFGDPLFRIKRV